MKKSIFSFLAFLSLWFCNRCFCRSTQQPPKKIIVSLKSAVPEASLINSTSILNSNRNKINPRSIYRLDNNVFIFIDDLNALPKGSVKVGAVYDYASAKSILQARGCKIDDQLNELIKKRSTNAFKGKENYYFISLCAQKGDSMPRIYIPYNRGNDVNCMAVQNFMYSEGQPLGSYELSYLKNPWGFRPASEDPPPIPVKRKPGDILRPSTEDEFKIPRASLSGIAIVPKQIKDVVADFFKSTYQTNRNTGYTELFNFDNLYKVQINKLKSEVIKDHNYFEELTVTTTITDDDNQTNVVLSFECFYETNRGDRPPELYTNCAEKLFPMQMKQYGKVLRDLLSKYINNNYK